MKSISLPDFQRLCVRLRTERKTRFRFNNGPSSAARVGMEGKLVQLIRNGTLWKDGPEVGAFRITDGRPKFENERRLIKAKLHPEQADKYDVVIYEIESRVVHAVVHAVVGKDLALDTGFHNAAKRFSTAIDRINENFNAGIVNAGKFTKGDVLPEGCVILAFTPHEE